MADLTFSEVEGYCNALKADLGEEKAQMKNMAKSFNLEWESKSTLESQDSAIKVTISPSMRNKTLGGVRLLTTTEPSFSIPQRLNTKEVMENADKVEQIAKRLLEASNTITNNTAEYDILLSVFLYGQAQYGITRTKDLLANANSDEARRRYGDIAYVTPALVDVYDPIQGYVDRDRFGVRRYYREVDTTAQAVADEFKKPGVLVGRKPETKVTLCQLYTWKIRWVWLKGEKDPIHIEVIKIFPIGQTLGEGSTLFEDKKHHGQPFAYGLWESGMWQRQNLAWTATMTILYNLMLSANFISEANSSDEYAERPARLGGDIQVPHGAKYGPMDMTKLLPQQLFSIMDMLNQQVEETTIYGQTLGAPLGKGDAFAKVALLHQAGRLPLSMFSRKGAIAIAHVMKTALSWLKIDPPTDPTYGHILGDLGIEDIPDHYHMEANLDVGLPQDSVESARVFSNLTDPRNPGASKEWGMENILKIKQPKEEMNRIYKEQAFHALFEQWLSEKQLATKENQQVLQQVAEARRQIQKQQGRANSQGQEQPQVQPGV